jgi:gliding motility-associated-like protein
MHTKVIVLFLTHFILDTARVTISNGAVIEIIQGNSVSLNATNAESYSWFPTTYLDSPEINNPIASPTSNITYMVVGYSKDRCISEDSISIKVKKESFIPALFTPNEDGKNDQLLIYGLKPVENFEFLIFSRAGNLVFKTTDFELMKSTGWDGKQNNSPPTTGKLEALISLTNLP